MESIYGVPYIVQEVEGILKFRCSDARDAGALEIHMKRLLELEYLARGVKPDVTSLSLAGTFVTPDVALEVTNIMHKLLNSYSSFYRKNMLNLVVQIIGHGDVHSAVGAENRVFYAPSELEIAPHSKFNCGMGHASKVWAKFIGEIRKKGLKASYFDRAKKSEVEETIKTDEQLLIMLRNVNHFQGDSVVSFVNSITNLIQHPLDQKAILRMLLNRSLELGSVPIHINSAVVNYETGFCPRIDSNEHVYTFIDDMTLLKHVILSSQELLSTDDSERVRRVSPQKETVNACLISSGNVSSARTKVANWLTSKGIETDVAGGVFAIITKNASQQYSPFGPYKEVSLFYAAHPELLGIKTFVILGEDMEEAERIRFKVYSDPLMRFVVDNYGVEFRLVTKKEVESVNTYSNSSAERDSRYRSIVSKALRDLVPPSPSVLHQPIINKELGKMCVRQ